MRMVYFKGVRQGPLFGDNSQNIGSFNRCIGPLLHIPVFYKKKDTLFD